MRSFEIAQEPDFFQYFRRKVVGFVDHESCRQLLLVARNHIVGNLKQQLTFVLAGGGKSQIAGKVLQELDGRQTAVEYISVGDVIRLLQQLQEVMQQKSLASPNLPG